MSTNAPINLDELQQLTVDFLNTINRALARWNVVWTSQAMEGGVDYSGMNAKASKDMTEWFLRHVVKTVLEHEDDGITLLAAKSTMQILDELKSAPEHFMGKVANQQKQFMFGRMDSYLSVTFETQRQIHQRAQQEFRDCLQNLLERPQHQDESPPLPRPR